MEGVFNPRNWGLAITIVAKWDDTPNTLLKTNMDPKK